MFPPGRGNDHLGVGDIYLISMFGTNEMLTAAAGGELCLREYQEGHHDQMWICETNSDERIGMRNRHNGCFLGRGGGITLRCTVPQLLPLEWLTFRGLSQGGYSIWVHAVTGKKLCPLQRVDSNSPHLKVGKVCAQFGLHKLKNPVFRRFEWVIPGRLARSSAPYYDGEDADESINETSIEFLINYGIENIISLNSVELSPRQKGRLSKAKISYSHIKALKCTAVTQDQFDQIWNAYNEAGVTIIYCGYGDGRVGMAISAIQLFQGRALDDNDYMENGVQCPSQIAALNALSERINGVESESGSIDIPESPTHTNDSSIDTVDSILDTQPPPYATPDKKKY